jgi:hypothetical protein
MVGVQNRLTGAAKLCSAINNNEQWNTVNLVSGEILTSELVPNSSYKQLSLTVQNGQPSGQLTLGPIQLLAADTNRPIILLFAAKLPSGGTITTFVVDESSVVSNVTTTAVVSEQSNAAVNAPGLLSPQWFIFRSDSIVVEAETPTISIYITFQPNDLTETFYFTTPAVYHKYEFFISNPAVPAIASLLPTVFLDIDSESQESLDVPLLRLIDILNLGLGESLELMSDFAYSDIEDGYIESDNSTKSTLAHHEIADIDTLLWLAKFNGTNPILRFNSSLEISSEPFVLDVSVLNGTDVIRLTSYDELNPPALTIAAQETLLRWQMEYGYYGRNAGTLPAIVAAAKLMLIDNQNVSISYDYSVEPFVVDMQTQWFETIGAAGPEDIGNESQLILEAIAPARPLGTLVRHEMIG